MTSTIAGAEPTPRRPLRRARGVRHLVQGLVIGSSILAALFADAWWDGVEARGRERRYRAGLVDDFAVNQSRLLNAVARGDSVVAAALVLLAVEGPEQSRTIGSDSMSRLLRALGSLPTFEPVTRTFDNIVGAGDLLTLRDDELRMKLADFQSRLLLMNVVQETQERQYVAIFQPYIIEQLDYLPTAYFMTEGLALPPVRDADAVHEVAGTRVFRNWVVARLAWADDVRDQHRQALATALEVIARLEEEGR